jgi:hypothetical protein
VIAGLVGAAGLLATFWRPTATPDTAASQTPES